MGLKQIDTIKTTNGVRPIKQGSKHIILFALSFQDNLQFYNIPMRRMCEGSFLSLAQPVDLSESKVKWECDELGMFATFISLIWSSEYEIHHSQTFDV